MDPPVHRGDENGGSGGSRRRQQAQCRGGSPGVKPSSATAGERRQCLFVLGLLRLGERPPVLAWGMARREGVGTKESWGRGKGRGRGRAGVGKELSARTSTRARVAGLGLRGVRTRARIRTRATGLDLGLGRELTQELLSVFVVRFGRQERPLLFAELVVRACEGPLGTRRGG